MLAVTVEFRIKPGQGEVFLAEITRHARNSLTNETGCRRFDVCRAPNDAELFFLYEVYADEAAFKQHIASAHFARFGDITKDLIASRDIKTWSCIVPA